MTLFGIPLNVSDIKGSFYLLSFDNFGALVLQSFKEQSKDTAHLMFWVRCTLTGRINVRILAKDAFHGLTRAQQRYTRTFGGLPLSGF